MAFIRKFKTGSGATGVQVCWKQGGEVVKTVHIGSANSDVGLEKLLKKAQKALYFIPNCQKYTKYNSINI